MNRTSIRLRARPDRLQRNPHFAQEGRMPVGEVAAARGGEIGPGIVVQDARIESDEIEDRREERRRKDGDGSE